MKRAMFFLFLVLTLSLCTAFSEEAKHETEIYYGDDFNYVVLEDDTAKIVGYNWKNDQVIIPEMLDGHVVSEIGEAAFYGDLNFGPCLYSAILPNTIRRIEREAFNYNNLLWINLPERITEIGESAIDAWKSTCIVSRNTYAEKYCKNNDIQFIYTDDYPEPLSFIVDWDGEYQYCAIGNGPAAISDYWGNDAEIIVPPTLGGRAVEEIRPHAFYYGPGDSDYSVKSVELPEGIKKLGRECFSCRYGLTSIILPKSVESIGDGAFFGCESLSSISLPDSVSEIGTNPFIGCYALEKVDISIKNPHFEIIEGSLYSIADKRLICTFAVDNIDFRVYVQDGTKIIGAYAFDAIERLSEVVLPMSISAFEEYEKNNIYDTVSNVYFVVHPNSFAEKYCDMAGYNWGYELSVG